MPILLFLVILCRFRLRMSCHLQPLSAKHRSDNLSCAYHGGVEQSGGYFGSGWSPIVPQSNLGVSCGFVYHPNGRLFSVRRCGGEKVSSHYSERDVVSGDCQETQLAHISSRVVISTWWHETIVLNQRASVLVSVYGGKNETCRLTKVMCPHVEHLLSGILAGSRASPSGCRNPRGAWMVHTYLLIRYPLCTACDRNTPAMPLLNTVPPVSYREGAYQ